MALARQDSPARGSRHLGLARALVHEMPHTLAAPARGDISVWRATLLVRETAGDLYGAGDRTVAARARPPERPSARAPDETIETTTPTGHGHDSRAPDPPEGPPYPLRIDLARPATAA